MSKSKTTTTMRAAKWAGRAIEWQKKAIDRAMKVIERIQHRAEGAVQDVIERSNWLPKEGKEVAAEWIKMFRKSRADVRRTVDVSLAETVAFCKRVEAEPPARPVHKAKKVVHRGRRVHARKAAVAS